MMPDKPPLLPSTTSSHSWYGSRQLDRFYKYFRSGDQNHHSSCRESSVVSCCCWKEAQVSSKQWVGELPWHRIGNKAREGNL